MKKKIILAIIVFSTLIACGKKGDPEYKDPEQKVEKIIPLKNKA